MKDLLRFILASCAFCLASFSAQGATPIQSGALDYRVCVSWGSIKVRTDDMQEKFQVPHGARALPVQLTDVQPVFFAVDENGPEEEYRLYQFPDSKEPAKRYWAVKRFIQLKSQCKYPMEEGSDDADAQTRSSYEEEDTASFRFPLNFRPDNNYLNGIAQFGYSRSGGARIHAGCDLYLPQSSADIKEEYKSLLKSEFAKIYSVGAGRVLRGVTYFYEGTYDLPVKLDTGKIVRYGEVQNWRVSGITTGARVKKGTLLARVGKTHCCRPMLHLEIYKGTLGDEPLTPSKAERKRRREEHRKDSSNYPKARYDRRDDLIDSTPYLQDWEYKTFKRNYK